MPILSIHNPALSNYRSTFPLTALRDHRLFNLYFSYSSLSHTDNGFYLDLAGFTTEHCFLEQDWLKSLTLNFNKCLAPLSHVKP